MQKRHNPLTFYLRELMYMLMALVIRLVALSPLVCLYVFPSGSPWKYLALICPLMMLFVVLPLRFSFAEAMVQKPRQRNFSFDTALGMGMYGEKLGESLLHALNVLKWGIPFLLMLGGGYYLYKTVDDSFALIAQISALGRWVVSVWNAVANFFITLFGSINTLTYQGGLGEGLYTVGAILGLGLLIWLYGAVRNSSTRYIWVLATRAERSPRVEIRRRLRGRRWNQLLTALVNLVLWAPFIWVVCLTFKDVVSDVSGKLMVALAQKSLPSVDLIPTIKPLALAFLCLYFPLLPARRWISAAFSARDVRHVSPELAAGEGVAADGAPYVHSGSSLFEGMGSNDGVAEYEATDEGVSAVKPAVFESAATSEPEPTPMAADEPPEEPAYKPLESVAYKPTSADAELENAPSAPVSAHPAAEEPISAPAGEPAYKPYDPAEAGEPASAEAEPKPIEIKRAPIFTPESDEQPRNDPPTFTLGQ